MRSAQHFCHSATRFHMLKIVQNLVIKLIAVRFGIFITVFHSKSCMYKWITENRTIENEEKE